MSDDEQYLVRLVPDPELRLSLSQSIDWNQYVKRVDLWSERLAPDRLRIVTMQEISQDPIKSLAAICDGVGIDASFYDTYSIPHLSVTHAGQVRGPGLVARAGRRFLP